MMTLARFHALDGAAAAAQLRSATHTSSPYWIPLTDTPLAFSPLRLAGY